MGKISVTGVGKAYKQYPTRWARLFEWILPFFKAKHQLKWILKDIHFSIDAGEAVGIIGINGAGKSTLLKLITGTTQPSSGVVDVKGRVSALLELGIGFHPDVTGRENAVMAGQLMGISAEEMRRLLPEIVAFSGIGNYINLPIRVYSSGMQMRLAFSVATCIRPDVLIVDEALAVGDVFFQQKCFERIQQFINAGTTLLFVSHSSATILNLCSRCIFIRSGTIAFDGEPKKAIDLYQAELLREFDGTSLLNNETQTNVTRVIEGDHFQSMSSQDGIVPLFGKTGSITTEKADCIFVGFMQNGSSTIQTINSDETVCLSIAFHIKYPLEDPHVGFKIRNRFGVVMFETNTYCMGSKIEKVEANSTLNIQFSFLMSLFPDQYTITVGLANHGFGEGSFKEIISYLHEVSIFEVLPNPKSITWAGLTNLQPKVVQVKKQNHGN
jgi:lipopolysaccharide transport system ATP-binding protein